MLGYFIASVAPSSRDSVHTKTGEYMVSLFYNFMVYYGLDPVIRSLHREHSHHPNDHRPNSPQPNTAHKAAIDSNLAGPGLLDAVVLQIDGRQVLSHH